MFGYRVMAKKLDILIFPSLCEKHCRVKRELKRIFDAHKVFGIIGTVVQPSGFHSMLNKTVSS